MRIRNLNLDGMVLAAPMAGISNPAYRLLCRRFGAAAVYTEMISSHGLAYNNKRTNDLVKFSAAERPLGIQLFGADPEIMQTAARIASQFEPDIIDLNFGCPVKKIVRKNGGAAVLKDLGLTRALIEAAVSGSRQPVTVKLRSGWDELTKVFLEAGLIAEEAGAAAVTLHARTRNGLFAGRACWDDIKRLKEAVSIPVIGNGDITCGADAARMLKETGCDAVMIGRAAMGNPWIFREVNHYLRTGMNMPRPSLEEKAELILEHARLLIRGAGEDRALLKMRGILIRYTRGWRGGGELRKAMISIKTLRDLENLLEEYKGRAAIGDTNGA